MPPEPWTLRWPRCETRQARLAIDRSHHDVRAIGSARSGLMGLEAAASGSTRPHGRTRLVPGILVGQYR